MAPSISFLEGQKTSGVIRRSEIEKYLQGRFPTSIRNGKKLFDFDNFLCAENNKCLFV
jgi:hypothetical protein